MGRGIMVIVAVVVLMMSLVSNSEGALHQVGGSRGWSTGAISTFPFVKGTVIMAGDQLRFKYDNTKHNVALVGASDYANCAATRGSDIFTSGDDKVTLDSVGEYYFLSTFPHDCKRNAMRFSVYAN